MKVIIAGSRNVPGWEAEDHVARAMRGREVSEVVSGCCRGVDHAGLLWAEWRDVPVKRFPADWALLGKSAGPVRNRKMAEYADELVLIWDGKSRGSADMKRAMTALGKPVHEVIVKEPR
jgi:hypothetical protein